MKLSTIIATLSFSAFVAATPIPLRNRALLPTPMQAVDKLFPNSGIPKLAEEIGKILEICTYMVLHCVGKMLMIYPVASRTGW
jgi:hypothetical protein